MSNRITFTAVLNTFTGYGLHATQIIDDLSKLGYEVAVRPIRVEEEFGAKIPTHIRERFVYRVQPEPWELLLHPPSFLPTPGKKTAFFTMWESTKLPPPGREVLNRAEVIIVPCMWNAACFSACGVTRPIRVIPLGINTDAFNYRPMRDHYMAKSGRRVECVFGAGGRMAHGGIRKGMNHAIELFLKAFPKEKDVVLRVKCFPDCKVVDPHDERVEITAAYLSEAEMVEWYSTLTCFISLAKGEGWGLMQHQAMACGRPVMSINYGGVAEFFNAQVGYPVNFKLDDAKLAYQSCGHWADIDDEHTIAQMRRVYKDRIEAEKLGIRAAKSVAHLSWLNSNKKLLEVLKEFKAI